MSDILRRYFVSNPAPVLSIKRLPWRHDGKFIRCGCGNSGGFYWGKWLVMWRKPYAKAWAYNNKVQRWEATP